MNTLLWISIIIKFEFISSNPTIEYYEKLISQVTATTNIYKTPKDNEAFKIGSNSNETTDIGSYDFIVVGAGSAGSVLATRLSENEGWKILLLEAGGEENDFSDIPAMSSYLEFTEMNWGYVSAPQKHCCLGMKDKKCSVPRGKAIGGSSVINAVMYVRGNREDYDGWAQLGNAGWSYEKVLPYFKKSENSQIAGDEGYHGKGGFLNIEYILPPTDFFENFIKGNAELNVSYLDYNGRWQNGNSKLQSNIKMGKRQSTGTAFLANARKRQNLQVLTKALVTKIIINPQNKTAFVAKDKKFTATATKEVIVSGGVVNSPQLPMLSGLGPKQHLDELEIEVIEDLPVGQILLEHPMFTGLTLTTNYTIPASNMTHNIQQYLKGYGPLTIDTEVISFLTLKCNTTTAPVVEFLFQSPNGADPKLISKRTNYDEELTVNYVQNMNTSSNLIIYVVLLHPKSRGQITLKSKNPIDFPNIDLNMFAESEDVDVLTEGIEFALKLLETEAFRKINASFMDIPVCKEFEKFSKKFWECAIRHMAVTIDHPCGTTAMGLDKASSVVDNNLKVHGINKLRVVDAGVFPTSISGHPNAAVMMIAEKISDIIKNDYK